MNKKRLYFAAGLFNWADQAFNLRLAEKLENWYNVILPQREGFEFSKLAEAFQGLIPDNRIENAVNRTIYLLDKEGIYMVKII